MESITKNRQSPDTLKAMVARAYGPGQVPDGDGWATEFANGWFNVAYRIRLRDGAEVVLKIAPPPGVEVLSYERGAMATELAALRTPAANCAARSTSSCRSSQATTSRWFEKDCPRPTGTPTAKPSAWPTAS
jgi:hypothetical protein